MFTFPEHLVLNDDRECPAGIAKTQYDDLTRWMYYPVCVLQNCESTTLMVFFFSGGEKARAGVETGKDGTAKRLNGKK